MKTETRDKFISDVNLSDKNLRARQPFKVVQEEHRRFVRVEIEALVDLRTIKDGFGGFWVNDEAPKLAGSLLNISEVGALIEIDQPLAEGDIVAIGFTFQGIPVPDAVLGLVKRVDLDEDFNVVGIEFIDRNRLNDFLQKSEMDLLSDKLTSFSDSVRNLLGRYLYDEASQ